MNSDQKLDLILSKLSLIEGRLTVVEDRLTSLESRMTSLEGKVSSLEDRMTAVEGQVTGLRIDFDDFAQSVAREFTEVHAELGLCVKKSDFDSLRFAIAVA